MGSSGYDYKAAIADVIERTAASHAEEVDRSGLFPRGNIEALAGAGLLGLTSGDDVGGRGEGLAAAAHVIERLGGACGSTAMILLMHLTTLAFSEAGSRSHFWAPMSGAVEADQDRVRLDADKSWVTSAGEADSYVWSSRPIEGDGPMTLWLVPRDTEGLKVRGPFDGLGLRGNGSSPMTADGVTVARDRMIGSDGTGLDIALRTALPTFLVLNAAFSLGLMEALVAKTGEHLGRTTLRHLGRTLAEQPMQRTEFARLRIRTDEVRAFLRDVLAALAEGREDATLRVLQAKAVAAEAASEVADGAMRLCGGSAFRRELGIERLFRDSLAARVMAPTTPALHDFVGRAALGMPLF